MILRYGLQQTGRLDVFAGEIPETPVLSGEISLNSLTYRRGLGLGVKLRDRGMRGSMVLDGARFFLVEEEILVLLDNLVVDFDDVPVILSEYVEALAQVAHLR